METAALTVMFLIFCLICCFIFFLCGFMIAFNKFGKSAPRTEPELSEEDKNKIKRQKKEYDNFMSYDGSSQE